MRATQRAMSGTYFINFSLFVSVEKYSIYFQHRNKMKQLKEIILGAIVFLLISRMAKLISTTIVTSNSFNSEEYKKMSLTLELLILFLALFIAYQYI